MAARFRAAVAHRRIAVLPILRETVAIREVPRHVLQPITVIPAVLILVLIPAVHILERVVAVRAGVQAAVIRVQATADQAIQVQATADQAIQVRVTADPAIQVRVTAEARIVRPYTY